MPEIEMPGASSATTVPPGEGGVAIKGPKAKKAPAKKSAASAKKSAAKKSPAKKSAAKKAPAEKASSARSKGRSGRVPGLSHISAKDQAEAEANAPASLRPKKEARSNLSGVNALVHEGVELLRKMAGQNKTPEYLAWEKKLGA